MSADEASLTAVPIEILRESEDGALMFWCPGCRHRHVVWVGDGKVPRWAYNGEPRRPTFHPSLLVTARRAEPPVTGENIDQWRKAPWEQKIVETRCHSFIEGGSIRFLDDCTHELAGQTVLIPPFQD